MKAFIDKYIIWTDNLAWQTFNQASTFVIKKIGLIHHPRLIMAIRNKIKIGILLWGLIFIVGCNQKNKIFLNNLNTTAWDSVKTSTDYLDYLDFIINNTESKYFDTALVTYFKYKEILFDSIEPPMWDCFNRCISVIIKNSDSILFEYEPIKICNLHKNSLTYLINENNDENIPGQKLVKDKYSNERYISNGFFYIQTDLESNGLLRQGISEIKLAYKNYKNYLSERWYNLNFEKLNPEKKEVIDDLAKRRIIIEKYYEIIVVPENIIDEDILIK